MASAANRKIAGGGDTDGGAGAGTVWVALCGLGLLRPRHFFFCWPDFFLHALAGVVRGGVFRPLPSGAGQVTHRERPLSR